MAEALPLLQQERPESPSPSELEPLCPFHVLYRRAYDRTVSGICTEFCENVLVDFDNANNRFFNPNVTIEDDITAFFYPKRDVGELHPDDTFEFILNICYYSLILLSNDNIECELYDKFLEQSLSAKNRVPVLSIRFGRYNEELDEELPVQHLEAALNPVKLTAAVKENWIKEKVEINRLLKTYFAVSSIDKPDPEELRFSVSNLNKFTSASDLLNFHNDSVNKLKEEDALTRWMKTYNLGNNVEKIFNDCGISTKEDILQVYNNLDEWRTKRGLNLNVMDFFDFQRGAQDIESRTFIWREKMDFHVLKSTLWHLVTTIRLRQNSQEQSEEFFVITDASVFIEALSRQLCHPENCLHLVKQGPGSLTFVAKCIDLDDFKSLRRRIIEKASNFEQPFCVLENIELYSELSNRPPIVSKIIDLSEEYDIKIFNAGCIEQITEVPLIGMEALPDEILVKIFQMLPFFTKICVLPKVCENWKRIAKDVIVLSTFNLREIPERYLRATLQFVIHLIRTNTYLRPRKLILPRLKKKDIILEKKAVFELLETGSKLGLWKFLTKVSAQEVRINEEVFSNFVSSFNSEIFTELSVDRLTPNKMNSICGHLTKLQRFTVRNTVDAESLLQLNVGRDIKYLRELRVYVQSAFPDGFVSNLLNSNHKQLELLTISLLEGKVAHFRDFIKSLRLCRKLTYLDLRIPDAVLFHDKLWRSAASITKLRQLYLSTDELTFASNRTYDDIFKEFNNLRHVYACMNLLFDKDVTDLCINCGHCLETINLVRCHFLSDDAVTCIMTYCNKLVVLRLDDCMDINNEKLLKNVTENLEKYFVPRLVLLNFVLFRGAFTSDEISDDLLKNFLTARPQLFIKIFSGERRITDNLIDEIAVSSLLYKILGPKCHHRKSLIRALLQ